MEKKESRLCSAAIRQHHQLRRQLVELLAYHGLNVKKTKPEEVVSKLEDNGYSVTFIAQVIRLFFPSPDGPDGKPATSMTRESRVELMTRRVDAGLSPCNPDDVVQGMLDDHLNQSPEGKPRTLSYHDTELLAEAEEAAEVVNLDEYDKEPRRRMKEWEERQNRDGQEQAILAIRGLRALAMAN